jgi:hypothetical protein
MEEKSEQHENSLIEGIKVGTLTSMAAATVWVGGVALNTIAPVFPQAVLNVIPHTGLEAAIVAVGVGVLAGTAKAAHHHITHASHEGKIVEEKSLSPAQMDYLMQTR